MSSMSSLIHLLSGSLFWLVVIWAAWTGYEIGKEAKTNWFSDHSQREARFIENDVTENTSNQVGSKPEQLRSINKDNLNS